MGIRCAVHVTPLYPRKLALTSPTGGGRSVDIVRSRTKATEFFYVRFTEHATENKANRNSIHRFSKQQNNRPNKPTDQQKPTKTNQSPTRLWISVIPYSGTIKIICIFCIYPCWDITDAPICRPLCAHTWLLWTKRSKLLFSIDDIKKVDLKKWVSEQERHKTVH